MTAITDLKIMLQTMGPVLNPGTYVFVTLPHGTVLDQSLVIASIREREGLSVVLAAEAAADAGLASAFEFSWITLSVYSDLQAVGLTAAFSTALGVAGISCNVVAGTQHDHLFVPVELAQEAMRALRALQQEASSRVSGSSEPSPGRRGGGNRDPS